MTKCSAAWSFDNGKGAEVARGSAKRVRINNYVFKGLGLFTCFNNTLNEGLKINLQNIVGLGPTFNFFVE